MTARRKSRKPTAAKLVRTMARTRVGTVPGAKLVPDKRARPDKHKRNLAQRPDDAA